MQLANYHTHTVRCGHARGEDKAYVEAAIQAGIRVLGFSDHCPWVFPDDTVSGCRMLPSQLDDYFTSLTGLRDEYKNDITIYIGFESEYLPELLEAQEKLLADYPVDYQILGQHFITREPFGRYCGTMIPDQDSIRSYIQSCIAGMETGRYKYLAHPDLIPMLFSAPKEELDRLFACMKAHDYPLEVNLLGMLDHRHYPDLRFWKLAQESGCKAIIGYDAHTPDALLNTEEIELCIKLAGTMERVEYLPGLGPKTA